MRRPKPQGRNDNHIFDYSKVAEKIYIGSDLCKGSTCPIHSEEFRQLGVCVELNLNAEKKEIPPDDMNLYCWLPVVDGYPPSPDQLDLGSSIINQAVEDGNTVYVHCKNGHGRSPTMVAAYLIRYKGYGVDQAVKLIKERRPEIHIEENQNRALEEFAKRYKDSLID